MRKPDCVCEHHGLIVLIQIYLKFSWICRSLFLGELSGYALYLQKMKKEK